MSLEKKLIEVTDQAMAKNFRFRLVLFTLVVCSVAAILVTVLKLFDLEYDIFFSVVGIVSPTLLALWVLACTLRHLNGFRIVEAGKTIEFKSDQIRDPRITLPRQREDGRLIKNYWIPTAIEFTIV
ncbi:MAG: hypothetical protein OXR68_07825 [Alphaproteobacteria bacterium]|nr:hypothetical protein [Alphaproteobacteria bacterium]MDD9920512.1 hypothetical protein [Alphaproteobacteria bacterium]